MKAKTGVFPLLAAAVGAVALLVAPASAQTVIYDGSQERSVVSDVRFDDTFAVPLVPNPGDGVWITSGARTLNNTGSGLAGSAVGADAPFLSNAITAGSFDPQSGGQMYVLNDGGATTGPQKLNLSLYYNDPTPNADDPLNNASGGNVAIRVYGVTNNPETDPTVDPWESHFTLIAASGASAANIAAGQYNRPIGGVTAPVTPGLVESLLFVGSSGGVGLLPSPDWQSVSLDFDAGTGYDWLLFGFAGNEQDGTNIPSDRFAFDNIAFEAVPGVQGDFNGNGAVDLADYTVWRDNLGASDDGLILNGNGTGGVVDTTDYVLWKEAFGNGQGAATATLSGGSVPEPSSVLLMAVGMGLVVHARRRRMSY